MVLRDGRLVRLFRLDKRAAFPRLRITRRVERDGALYFGPFTSAQAARETWRLLARIFPLRTCSDRALRSRARPACTTTRTVAQLRPGLEPGAYAGLVQQVERFLSGKVESVLAELQREMQAAAQGLRFEQAALLRDRIKAVRRTRGAPGRGPCPAAGTWTRWAWPRPGRAWAWAW